MRWIDNLKEYGVEKVVGICYTNILLFNSETVYTSGIVLFHIKSQYIDNVS